MIKALARRALGAISRVVPARWVKRLPGAAVLYARLYRILKPSGRLELPWRGFSLALDAADEGITRPLLLMGEYEPYELEVFEQLIGPEDWIVDVGANVGFYTLVAASAARRLGNGKVLAFEPVPSTYRLLVENIRRNRLDNAQAFEIALADRAGPRRIFLDRANHGNPSLAPTNVPQPGDSLEIRASTLDGFLEDLGVPSPRIMKIDVQGAEGLVFQGAKRWLSGKDRRVLMEFWPEGLANLGQDPLSVLKLLRDLGFSVSIVSAARRALLPTSEQDALRFCLRRQEGEAFVGLLLQKP